MRKMPYLKYSNMFNQTIGVKLNDNKEKLEFNILFIKGARR